MANRLNTRPILYFFLLQLSAISALGADGAKLPAASYARSFKNLILDPLENSVRRNEAPECVSALRWFYGEGKSLSSDLIQSHTRLESTSVFFHYTNSKGMKKAAKKNQILGVFDFLRSPSRSSAVPWELLFYVADDTFSSADYGPILVKITTKADIHIIDEPIYHRRPRDESFGDLVRAEMIGKYPELSDCKESPSLYFLTAEDMEIDLIHYDWYIGAPHWYQVLNPYALDHMELAK